MKLKKLLYTRIYPPLGWLAITIYSRLLRVRTIGAEVVDTVKADGRPVIYALLHGRQFMVYRCLGHRNISVMTSTSRDGRLQAAVLQRFGFRIAWGSSAKSPVRALVGIIKLMGEGCDSLMAVDGPKGPLYKVKPGILFLAKKTNAVIIPFMFSSRKSVIMTAWDRYMLPKPFTRTVVLFGDPFHPSADTSREVIAAESEALESILIAEMKRADGLSGFNAPRAETNE
ncbi:lysophospholipid acyltransferase family protein [bacterium]|nr:lysophospholipid acyltransferase family protein [bacterium]